MYDDQTRIYPGQSCGKHLFKNSVTTNNKTNSMCIVIKWCSWQQQENNTFLYRIEWVKKREKKSPNIILWWQTAQVQWNRKIMNEWIYNMGANVHNIIIIMCIKVSWWTANFKYNGKCSVISASLKIIQEQIITK